MRPKASKTGIKWLISIALISALTGCHSTDGLTVVDPSPSDRLPANDPAGTVQGKPGLTVVDAPSSNTNQDVKILQTHTFEDSVIDSWVSEDEAKLVTIKETKPATETEEPEFSYTTFIMNLDNGERVEVHHREEADRLVKETVSPNGTYSFIQEYKDRYSADNFMKNLSTGELVPIPVDNYLELGGWLDNDTYILAAGSPNGPGELLQIKADDGETTVVPFEEDDVELFITGRFGVSNGRIYYINTHRELKVFEPGQTKAVSLIPDATGFDISPNGDYIAVAANVKMNGFDGSQLLIYDSAGKLQGSLIGKGDAISYFTWSPDSAKLAFEVINYQEGSSGMNGVYLFDTASGKVIPLASYYAGTDSIPYLTYPFRWNPNGSRLGITLDHDSMVFDIQ